MIIKPETKEDREFIYSVNHLAFGRQDEADLVDRIRESQQFIADLSLVAELDHKIVGHILFSIIKIESAEGVTECIGLAPMAVLPEYQNKGIGSVLVQIGLKKCIEMGYGLVIVLGHPKFYPKFGFFPASKLGIIVDFGEQVPDEAFMAYEAIPGTWKYRSGIVKYPPTFDGMD
jgi:putative acetyltransferase